jgi:4-amino-4-deoxy-L-arabinose transferase-like glycosyltransferase
VLLPATLVAAWRGRTRPIIRFALAAAIGPWLMFELVVTKLPHYLLVIFPMLALMTADWTARILRRQRLRSARPWGLSIAAAIYSIVALGFAAAPIAMKAPAPPAIALAVTWGLVLGVTWVRGHLRAGLVAAGWGMALVVAVAYMTWLGDAPILTASRRTALALETAGAHEAAMVHYREPSLAWYALKRGIQVHEAPEDRLPSDAIFAISTRRAWEQLSPAEQRLWEVVSSVPAQLYNDRLETAQVLVVRRREWNDPARGTTD